MKQVKRKMLAALLAVAAILSVCVLPTAAATSYPMEYTIYYMTSDGTKLGTYIGTCDATECAKVSIPSPSYEGYALSNESDATVTGDMIEWYFPASNYTRNGTGSYTVIYEPLCYMTAYFLYEDGRQAAKPVTVSGKSGSFFRISAPTIADFTPDKTVISGRYAKAEDYDNVYYYRTYYTITYDANGGLGTPAPTSKASGIPHQLTDLVPTYFGRDFLGWAKSPTATTPDYGSGGWIDENEDLTLYAVWKTASYVITFDANGGTGAPSPQAKVYGTTLILSSTEPTRAGFNFLGWATTADATTATYASGGKWTTNRDTTLYAVWEEKPVEYAVYFNANGGSGAPATQTKIKGINLTLSSTVPTRTGYIFKGWGVNATATIAMYSPGTIYPYDSSITLYAVWEAQTFTVSYNANGGAGAPSSQTKIYGEALTLRITIPTRDRYKFLGWSESATATTPTYYAGGTYQKEASVTLYAVWEYINYDFSVSDLTVTPGVVYQYDTVTVKFRVDSWDQKNAYLDIPIDLYLNGSLVHSAAVDFNPYGMSTVTMNLNVGTLVGTQTLEARINWKNHLNETRSNNNRVSMTFDIGKLLEVGTDCVAPNATYIAGYEVISTFYVINDMATEIIPSDHLTFYFEVTQLDANGNETLVYSTTWEQTVIPANASNIVYFKWTVPEGCGGKTLCCKGTVNPAFNGNEQNKENNTALFTVVPQQKIASQTPHTEYEREAPAAYNAYTPIPTPTTGSSTWSMWVYENDEIVLKRYDIRIATDTPVITPDTACKTAIFENGTWTMKSGYGISFDWAPTFETMPGYSVPQADCYTLPQSVDAAFPEFNYQRINGRYRTLEVLGNLFRFAENDEANRNKRIHFIPVYMENREYIVSVTVTQMWTPAGMISGVRCSNMITLKGSIFDDFYVGN